MVFLDRDDTLIRDTGYLNRIEDLQFLDGVLDGLRTLLRHRWLPVVLTNQSGVARGYLDEDQLHNIHETLHQRLLRADAPLFAWLYCPHLPPNQLRERERDRCNPDYLTPCNCRKPSPGLWKEALNLLPAPLNSASSWSVGDRLRDVLPARKMGGRGLLLTDEESSPPDDPPPDLPRASSFSDAVRIILDECKPNRN